MKSIILLASCLVAGICLHAQRSTTAYAVTSNSIGTFNWTELRQIDLVSGKVIRNVFESSTNDFKIFNARSKAPINVRDDGGDVIDHMQLPLGGLSAACAYDPKNQRLYFAPIFRNELRYIDLKEKTSKFYYYSNEPMMDVEEPSAEQNHITRMVITGHGKGYALSNDAKHLVEFSTGKQQAMRDLGALIDAETNKGVSIFEKNSSWGGDLVADVAGNLYLFSANKHVFRIDPSSRIATFMGKVSGIPREETTNGAAVDESGGVILSSANGMQTYYRVNMNDLQAEPVKQGGSVYNCSDLANGNLLPAPPTSAVISREDSKTDAIKIFPNPVTGPVIQVHFSDKMQGRYELQLLDEKGKQVTQQSILVDKNSRLYRLVVPRVVPGAYVLNVVGKNGKVATEVVIKKAAF